MEFALGHDSETFRPSLRSYMILLDMLKKKNAQKEAWDLFERSCKVRASHELIA